MSQIPEDGLYAVVDGVSEMSVPTADGGVAYLGERQEVSTDRAFMRGGNTSFDLTLRHGPPFVIPEGELVELAERGDFEMASYALVVSGRAHIGSGRPFLIFRFDSEERALEVSQYLDVPIVYSRRRHPGHQLDASFTPRSESFEVDERVVITFGLTNIGTDALTIQSHGYGALPAAPDQRYIFAVYRNTQTVPDERGWMRDAGATGIDVLEPGETYSEVLDLSRAFSFDEPGLYRIYGTYSVVFLDPGSPNRTSIWSDYVTRMFTVMITDRADAELRGEND